MHCMHSFTGSPVQVKENDAPPLFHVQTREMVLSSVGFFSHNVVGEIECIYWTPGGERLADLQSAES